MFTAIAAVLGIISTLVAWKFNPKLQLQRELDAIFKELEELYVQRDKALSVNDSDTLTIVTANIIKLCQRKTTIFQRLG